MSLPTVLPEADRAVLEACVAAGTSAQRDVLRARIVLLQAQHSVRTTASRLGCSHTTVIKWRARYRAQGLAGLADRTRCGAPRTYHDADRRDLAAAATSSPPRPLTRWTHARLAEHLRERSAPQGAPDTGGEGGARRCPSRSWVGRTLRDQHIRVHTVRGWLHRKPDPNFDQRIAAIEDAVAQARAGRRTVVCLDEKTAVPVRTPCHAETRGPDGTRRREFEYRRRGTISWYGVQDVATGAVALHRSSSYGQRMNSEAFTMVLDDLVAAHGQDFTIVMDNGAAHTSGHTRRWMSLHPGVEVLFTPFHASWANPMEVQFSILTRQVITGGHHASAEHLDAAAQHWTRLRNRHHRPVRWSYQRRGPRTSDPEH